MKSTFVPTTLVKRQPGAAQPAPVQPKLPPGTRPSVHNGQMLVSTGLHDLDEILGGGIAVGTVLLIEEDRNTAHARALLKYFLVEGVTCGHRVIAASPQAQELVGSLPTIPSSGKEEETTPTTDDKKGEELKIAWQYQKYLAPVAQKPESKPTPHGPPAARAVRKLKPFCHSYDLSRPAGLESLENKVQTIDPCTLQDTQMLRNLYSTISTLLSQDSSNSSTKNITRIGIQSLGSPLWDTEPDSQSTIELAEFMHALRGLLRSSLAACVITFPAHIHPSSIQRRVMHLSDTVVTLQSFKGNGESVSEAFKDYSGIFHIRKLPRLNSLVGHMPDSLTYGFTMGRRKLTIETLHLPPEISRSQQEKPSSNKATGGAASLMCLPAGAKSVLEF